MRAATVTGQTSAPVRRAIAWGTVIVAAAAVLAACGGKSSPAASSPPVSTASASSSPSVAASSPASPSPGSEPGIVAVTSGGALEEIDPGSGAVAKTLVPSGVLGDEISVSPDGSTVYFAAKSGGCSEVESVPAGGGSTTDITAGTLPAVSPDGTMLAFAREPVESLDCRLRSGDVTKLYKLGIRTLSGGTQKFLPMLPASQASGIPMPISHLSWNPDHSELAVSIQAAQDNEGWNLNIVSATSAGYYGGGPGTTNVPVTGLKHGFYYQEGVFLPTGGLFVSRACCAGLPPNNKSRLLWEVSATGTEQHQVAIGYKSLVHNSLAVSPDGTWLLYLGGTDLYVSHDGQTPSRLTGGLIAAAWR
jgi:hypothetical protein